MEKKIFYKAVPKSRENSLLRVPQPIRVIFSDFIKIWDYHSGKYFFANVRSRLYRMGDYRYVLDVFTGSQKISVWYNSRARRWELFDGEC